MLILPAIDLMNGRCVRLEKGAFAHAALYEADPLAMAQSFERAGANWVHVIDLDGARTGKEGNRDWLLRICHETGLKVQSGGGLRTKSEVAALLEAGLDRAIIGSLAVRDPAVVERLLDRFGPERLTIALDVRPGEQGPVVAIEGWQAVANTGFNDLLAGYSSAGARHILVTDISRDGMLEGANVALYEGLAKDYPDLAIQASGGVRDMADLDRLAATGAAAAVVGKALYEGRISLEGLFDAG